MKRISIEDVITQQIDDDKFFVRLKQKQVTINKDQYNTLSENIRAIHESLKIIDLYTASQGYYLKELNIIRTY